MTDARLKREALEATEQYQLASKLVCFVNAFCTEHLSTMPLPHLRQISGWLDTWAIEHQNTMNKLAQALGRRAKGVRKTLTKAERARRAERMAHARKNRWPKGEK